MRDLLGHIVRHLELGQGDFREIPEAALVERFKIDEACWQKHHAPEVSTNRRGRKRGRAVKCIIDAPKCQFQGSVVAYTLLTA